MRTQVMHERARDLPWLEQCPADGGLSQRTVLDSFPFSIGRDEDLCLPIASKRVSRHHATILQTEEGYLLRDLESTNGTFVNGSQITQVVLNEGDLVVFADVEFTFYAGQTEERRNLATLVIDRGRPATATGEPLAWEVIRSVRRLEETLVSHAIDIRFAPVVRLADQELVGLAAEGGWEIPAPQLRGAEQVVYATDCRLTARLRQLRRRLAADAGRQLPESSLLFLAVEEAELGDPRLAESLVRLQTPLGGERRLVVVLPPGAWDSATRVQDFSAHLRHSGLLLACVADLNRRLACPAVGSGHPDFLILTAEKTRELQAHSESQRRLQQLLRGFAQHPCEVIASGLERAEEITLCRQLGCTLGQGPLFPHRPLALAEVC